MDRSQDSDAQEKEIKKLAEDVSPSGNNTPDSLADATTAPLGEDALGGHATQSDADK